MRALVLAAWLCAPASAALLAPARAGVRLSEAAGSRPTLLVPVFARCAGTCPVTALALRDALAGGGPAFRVIVLSFDPADTPRSLEAFRARLELPPSWTLARSMDGRPPREALDSLDFRYMRAPGGFEHPDEVFVLSAKGVWAATLTAGRFPPEDLRAAYRLALAADDASLSGRLRSLAARPAAWLAAAAAGLALCLPLVFLLGTRASRAPDGR